jgi:hypothetical protein
MTQFSRRCISISIRLLLIFALALPGMGCSLLFANWLGKAAGSDSAADPAGCAELYLVTNPEVTLAWDPPPSEVAAYKLYYRDHGAASWTFLAELPAAETPQFTLTHSSFGDGEFDFGVVAVGAGPAESPMHTSLDTTAYPDSGWYLRWEVL